MGAIRNAATVAVVTTLGAGIGASGASAYAISGGSFTGSATSTQTFTVASGTYAAQCTSATYSGSASGASSAVVQPSLSGCTFLGFPATATFTGAPWWINVVAGPTMGRYRLDLHTPSTGVLEFNVPLVGCEVEVYGKISGVAWNAGWLSNVTGGAALELAPTGFYYSASGCPFSGGVDGVYNTNGTVTLPGITVS